MTNFSPRFCVYKRASSLFTGIVFKFHMHVQIKQKDRICITKGSSVKSPEYANHQVKKLVIYYNITATLGKSFCDAINPFL